VEGKGGCLLAAMVLHGRPVVHTWTQTQHAGISRLMLSAIGAQTGSW
jgi:hypothetical protein